MFRNAKIGDKVWSFNYGWGVITEIKLDNDFYPIIVTYLQGIQECYTYEGKWHVKNVYPTLFWDEVKFEIPPKPMSKLEVDTKILV